MPAGIYGEHLRFLYAALNRREFVHPDPLEFLYPYKDIRDREIVGLVASALAYGNVTQILRSVARVLERLPSPYRFLMSASHETLTRTFSDFKHRFTTGQELAMMLYGIKETINRYGSLHSCFASAMSSEHETIVPALTAFVAELSSVFEGKPRSLLPSPAAGSACKRHNLFLRWMVRRDAVDPGGWGCVPASKLIVPLDTHMHRMSLQLGLTKRKQANLRAALEITDAFRSVAPEDPVRFDFAITRLGIRDDTDPQAFVRLCRRACSPARIWVHR